MVKWPQLCLNRSPHIRGDSYIWSSVFNCSHTQPQPPQSSFPAAAGTCTLLHHRPTQSIIQCSPAQPEAFLNTLRPTRVSLLVASMMRSVSLTHQNPVEVSGFLCGVCHCPVRQDSWFRGFNRRGWGCRKKRAGPHLLGRQYDALRHNFAVTEFKFF